MKRTVLKKYAQLIVRSGLNVQKGQDVVITCGLEQSAFVRDVVEECYRCGARTVRVEWNCQPLEKLHMRWQKAEDLGRVEGWQLARLEHEAETLPATLRLAGDDPDGLKGIDQKKAAKAARMRYPVIKPIRDRMENRHQWCVAAVPGRAWAKKVFPNVRAQKAEEMLWEAILSTSRVTDDPIEEWRKHDEELRMRCEHLNSLGIRELVYKSANGTDLRVGVIPEALFMGGGTQTVGGVFYNPNIPTEECFTTPMRGQAEGWAVATMPLSYRGQLIENFRIRFEGGKAVEWDAEKNGDLLRSMIEMDEGSAYLGECALVPYSSPVRRTGLLFYNTLFDENAACHLALGRGYPDTIRGFENMTLDECRALGVNDSMVHTDFMIGSEDLSIDAVCEDGRTEPVFRGGTWAF